MTGTKFNILIVDDENQIVTVLGRVLKAESYNLRHANRAKDAISMVKTESFDAVLCDIRMPQMDGIDFLQEVKTINPNLEVIMLTGFATNDSSEKAEQLGAFDFLTKPLRSLDELKASIDSAALKTNANQQK